MYRYIRVKKLLDRSPYRGYSDKKVLKSVPILGLLAADTMMERGEALGKVYISLPAMQMYLLAARFAFSDRHHLS